jgi:hypothetical protein
MGLLEMHMTRPDLDIWNPSAAIFMAESIAFQGFLITMAFWSRPEHIEHQYTERFLGHCNRILGRPLDHDNHTVPVFSPVFGMDWNIILAMVKIKCCFARTISSRERQELIDAVQEQLTARICTQSFDCTLETPHKDSGRFDSHNNSISHDVARLVLLIISVFLEHLQQSSSAYMSIPRPSESSWQLRRIISILKRRHGNVAWSNCYLGTWPVYTTGIFMRSTHNVELVRDDLRLRWNATHLSHIARYLDDLRDIWQMESGVMSGN